MPVDRVLQNAILRKLDEAYPAEVSRGAIDASLPDKHEQIAPNLHYLQEHGLVHLDTRHRPLSDRDALYYCSAKITAKGVDFLAGDGGLSAVLGVMTVKLHDETIQALLASKVEASDLPPEQKQTLISQIRELRGEAAKHLVTKIIDYGITKGPDAMHWLSEALQKAAS